MSWTESVPRGNPANHSEHIVTYPRFSPSSQSNEQFEVPADLSKAEKSLLNSLQVDEDKLNDIEIKTRSQSGCPEWKLERKFRFTASNFGLIRDRKRNDESLVKNLINPNPFSSRYTNHGLKYDSIALEQYQKYMSYINKPVKVFKSGLVISMDAPYLGASPDGKVIDHGCSDPFGLSEVKCPETKYLVTPPWMHAPIAAFLWKKSMENLNLNAPISIMSNCKGWWVWLGQNGAIS